jgi:hypothetical protein
VSASLVEMTAMVADVYEAECMDPGTAVGMLRTYGRVSSALAAILIRDEMAARQDAVRARDEAADEAARRDDGSWAP